MRRAGAQSPTIHRAGVDGWTTECGYYVEDERQTTDATRVTCKTCIKKMAIDVERVLTPTEVLRHASLGGRGALCGDREATLFVQDSRQVTCGQCRWHLDRKLPQR